MSTLNTAHVTSPPGWRRVDNATVTTVLYIGPFTPSEWGRVGPAGMAHYVVSVVKDPCFPIEMLVQFVSCARRDPAHPLPDLGRLTAAEEFAARVMTALEHACQA